MKLSRFADRTHRQAGRAVRQHWPAGRNAEALAPPPSGIDFADRGLPERLRAGIESLSGLDLSDVRVHANSDKPAQLNALAYAQGNDIHLGPGQERSLPHEAWHVVQQRQGRVQPTLQMNGRALNDDAGLEREADSMGARALRAADATPGAPGRDTRAAGAVIQRNIGFEYETGVDTYLAAAPLTDLEREDDGFPAGAVRLAKGDVIVADMNGLHAKVDQGGPGLGTNLEFETDPFPESAAGRVALNRALKNLERFCGLIEAERGTTPHLRGKHLAAAFGGSLPPVAGANLRYLRASGHVNGDPQSTVGISLDKVVELMEQGVGGPTAGPHAVGLGATAARLELGTLVPPSHPDFRTVGNAPESVRQGIANYVVAYGGAAAIPGGFPSAELVGLCSLLLTYIIRGTGPQAFAKQIAPIMARTDFGHIFTQDLQATQAAEAGFLSAGGGTEFTAMFAAITTQAGVGGLGAQLFSSEPTAVAAWGLNISGSLTRQAWLAGISQGNDLLTPTTFPSVIAQNQMAGLGEKGAQHDPDPTGGAAARPILELRRIMQDIDPHDFTELAMGVFDYVVALNAGANPTYGRVARAQKQPKWHQELRYKLAGG